MVSRTSDRVSHQANAVLEPILLFAKRRWLLLRKYPMRG